MLGLLRLGGLIGEVSKANEDEKRLRLALSRTGWYLTDAGQLRAFAGVDMNRGGRQALDEQVARLRRSTADAAPLIGTAKELLNWSPSTTGSGVLLLVADPSRPSTAPAAPRGDLGPLP